MTADDEVTFREEQRLSGWFQALVIVVVLPVAAVLGYAMIQQLAYGRPWGDRPMSDPALATVGGAAIVFVLLIAALVCTSRLVTVVRGSGLFVRYVPFHFSPRRIALERVVGCQAVTYRPIRDYGGWGIRWASGGRAYNARGHRGVRLDFADGRYLLLGSQRPDELAEAINRLRGGPEEMASVRR